MDIKQLKYFVQVSKDKSFTLAAKSLFITQQALSKTIKNLEDELGVQLFYRTSRGVNLTEAGDCLLEKSKHLLNELESITNEIKDKFNLQKGTISLCVAPGVLRSLSPNIIIDFCDTYADIRIKKYEYNDLICENYIKKGIFDIGCSILPSNLDDIDFIPIKSEELYLIVNAKNPLSQKKKITFKDLANENFVAFDNNFELRHLLVSKCKEAGFTPNIIFESSDVALLNKLVHLNKGIFICVEHVIKDINEKDICFIPFSDKCFKWNIGFILKKGNQVSPILKTFMNYVLE
ncbi:LysR family transcriptional regulator [Clostridium beijerinckii]|uniref:HTH lysR-type domain-containing protein n=1 Tax=Clostridium beijerinckii TaxID=1520 RepID=A0A1S9N8J6_CLOBE|nr:LysR family transcriptional regulator [Clostridium beijerinckii]OOP73866.1 hypothetical protein CBEIBR21_05045 [Clostridium beijerinckii]